MIMHRIESIMRCIESIMHCIESIMHCIESIMHCIQTIMRRLRTIMRRLRTIMRKPSGSLESDLQAVGGFEHFARRLEGSDFRFEIYIVPFGIKMGENGTFRASFLDEVHRFGEL
jgi:hypothetical protein